MMRKTVLSCFKLSSRKSVEEDVYVVQTKQDIVTIASDTHLLDIPPEVVSYNLITF